MNTQTHLYLHGYAKRVAEKLQVPVYLVYKVSRGAQFDEKIADELEFERSEKQRLKTKRQEFWQKIIAEKRKSY